MNDNKVNIIIPIYNSYEFVVKCIDSVINNTPKEEYNLILVNDSSTDKKITNYLLELKNKKIENIFIHNNEKNVGFIESVNTGMAYNTNSKKNTTLDNDVILLNSDTEVTKNWLKKLKNAAYLKDNIATVTPLTNHGSICAIPENLKHNEIPKNFTLNEYADMIEKTSLKLYLEIPTAVGFCMYIKRKVINDIGLFDAVSYKHGYGEENDFCCRAKEKGYIHILCDDTFIYHKGSVSFSNDKIKYMEMNRKILDKKYPYYTDMVRKFIQNNSVKPIIDNVKLQLKIKNNKKNILFISHNDILNPFAGGSEHNTKDLIENIKTVNRYCLFVKGNILTLNAFIEDEILEFKYDIKQTFKMLDFTNQKYKDILEKIIQTFNIDCIHVKHFINHTFDIVDIAKEKNIPIFLTLHDYYLICPRINLLDCNNKYCEKTRSIKKCNECLRKSFQYNGNIIEKWNKNAYHYLKKFDKIFAPSQSVVENFNNYYKNIYGEFNVKIDVIEHGFPHIIKNTNSRANIFRVAFVGSIGPHKGRDLIYDMVTKNKNNNIEWHLFGHAGASKLTRLLGKSVINHNKYDREQIQRMLIDNKIDLICILSICPETYCNTLSEAISSRIPVLVTNLGALKERVEKYKCGWIIPYDSNAEYVLKQIDKIIKNDDEYNSIIDNLNKVSVVLREEIYKIYENFYLNISNK